MSTIGVAWRGVTWRGVELTPLALSRKVPSMRMLVPQASISKKATTHTSAANCRGRRDEHDMKEEGETEETSVVSGIRQLYLKR